jgi:hypothetical protein
MEINRAINDSEPLEPNPPRSEVLYYKSEKGLDRLLQVGEGPANIYQMVPIPADYSDFINNSNLGRAGQGIGRARVLQATRLSSPFLRLHLGRAGQGIGRAGVLQATRVSPPFLRLHLGRAGQGIGRAGVLQPTRLSPPFLRLHAGLGIGRAQVLQATRPTPPFFAYDLVG